MNTIKYAVLLLAIVLFLSPIIYAEDFKIGWSILAPGGELTTSTNFIHSGTISQPTTGRSFSGAFAVNTGYQLALDRKGRSCCLVPGDANNDGDVNILDITYINNFLYKEGPAPVCRASADPNNDCLIDILDIVFLINYKYKSGPPPICGCA